MVLLGRDHQCSDTLWWGQAAELATTVTGWTGNDARVVECTIDELRSASTEPMIRDVVDRGFLSALRRKPVRSQILCCTA
ncbi:hypothetical protein C3478_28355 [Mycobacterium kansasii]|nr:hypothetical protein C3478_28355 [Mycobacterium kansasii]